MEIRIEAATVGKARMAVKAVSQVRLSHAQAGCCSELASAPGGLWLCAVTAGCDSLRKRLGYDVHALAHSKRR
jgi:hypothetical protein